MTDKVNPFNSPDPTLRYDGEGLSPYKGEDPTQKYEQELNPFTQPDPTERYKEPVTPHDEMKELINQVALSKLESNTSPQITEQNSESGKITETSTQIQSNAISPGVVPTISSSPPVVSDGEGGGALGPETLGVCHLGSFAYRDFNCSPPRSTP